MNTGRNTTLVRGIALILLLVIFGCNGSNGGGGDEEATSSPESVRVPVRLNTLTRGDIESSITAVGNTEALRTEKVLSPVAGRVVSLNVLEGSIIHTGDVMIALQTREAEAAIAGAQALLRSATTEEQKREAQRALALADSLQPQIAIHAPFNGIVATRNVTEGELVADQTELLTVVDPSTIVFLADVLIRDLAEVRDGLPARITFPSMQRTKNEFGAVVDAISPQANLQSQSVQVRLRFRDLTADQTRLLKSNMPGTARIITGTHRNVLLVRRSSLLHDDETNTYSVVVMTPDSMAKAVTVTVCVQNDSIAEIHSEQLQPGQPLIVRGQYALADSTRVTVQPQ